MKKIIYDDAALIKQQLKKNNIIHLVGGLPTDMDGNRLVDLSVLTMTDLQALNTTTYDKQKILVENPGNLISKYFPSEFYCSNGGFKMVGGINTYTEATPRFRVTWPATTWNDGTFDRTSAAAGAQTTVSANPTTNVHGLTLANQVTAGNTYVYISGSNGIGSIDWPIGWMLVTDVPTAYGLTLAQTYNSELKSPIISDMNTESPVLRIPMPKFSNTYMGFFEFDFLYKNYVSAGLRTRIRYGVTGVAVSAGVEVNNMNDATAGLTSIRGRVANAGAIGKNISCAPAVNNAAPTGYLAGASPIATDVDNVTNSTDLLYTCIAPTGIDVVHELLQYSIRWRY